MGKPSAESPMPQKPRHAALHAPGPPAPGRFAACLLAASLLCATLLWATLSPEAAFATEPRPADVVADAILALGPDAPAEERARLAAELAEAKKRVATVLVKPQDGARALDAGSVLVDGRHAADLPLRRPLYLEPGERTLSIDAPGRRLVPVVATVEAGKNVSVRFRELEPAAPAPPPDDKPLWPGLVLAGAGAVGVGLGVGLLVVSLGKGSDAEDLGQTIGTCDTTRLSAACDDLASVVSERNAFQNGAVVSFIVGGVAGAASLAYFLVPTPRETPEASALRVEPLLGPTAWGLSIRGDL